MARTYKKSQAYLDEARKLIPGGVNSPVRSFKSVGGTPPFIDRGEGPYLYDVDGNRYIDYIGSWGPMILGHAHPKVMETIGQIMARGTSFGAPTYLEVRMARELKEAMPVIEKVRMVSSGTEATMSALRLARGATGRDAIVKFEGCYHGHGDSLLVEAGSGLATFGVPSSPGVPKALANLTLTVPYNDLAAFHKLMEAKGKEVACVIIEPIAGNMGGVLPQPGFLEGVQKATREAGAIFIVDEVMTGFRVARGGATQRFNLTPDLVTLGKVIGGGFPVGAYGGRADLMDQISPSGPIYQAGTLSGNPVAMAAGLAQLELLTGEVYATLEKRTEKLLRLIRDAADEVGLMVQTTQGGSLFGVFWMDEAPVNFAQVARTNGEFFSRLFHQLLDRGIYWAPSRFESGFVSYAHTDEAIEATGRAFVEALRAVR